MKLIYKVLLAGALIAFACNNNSKATNDTTTTDTVVSPGRTGEVMPADTSLSGCYSLIANRDTASLQLQRAGSTFTGSLSYNIYQKDRNDGTFQGEVSNGLLMGWYLFRSEGVMSVRQEAWKIADGKLIPATGEIRMRGDTALFADPAKLKFDTSRAFSRVNCII